MALHKAVWPPACTLSQGCMRIDRCMRYYLLPQACFRGKHALICLHGSRGRHYPPWVCQWSRRLPRAIIPVKEDPKMCLKELYRIVLIYMLVELCTGLSPQLGLLYVLVQYFAQLLICFWFDSMICMNLLPVLNYDSDSLAYNENWSSFWFTKKRSNLFVNETTLVASYVDKHISCDYLIVHSVFIA